MDSTRKKLNRFQTYTLRRCLYGFFEKVFLRLSEILHGFPEKVFEWIPWAKFWIGPVRKFFWDTPWERFGRDHTPPPRLNPQVQHEQERRWKTISRKLKRTHIFPTLIWNQGNRQKMLNYIILIILFRSVILLLLA